MTAQDDAPPPENALPDDIQPVAEETPSRFERLRELAIRWHPAAAAAVALALALTAWIVYPRQKVEPPPPADALYADALDRLYRLANPELPLLAATAETEADLAVFDLRQFFRHYGADIADSTRWINPHLLFGEALNALADRRSGKEADDLRHAALREYRDAVVWEQSPPPPPLDRLREAANLLRETPADPTLTPEERSALAARLDAELLPRQDEIDVRRRRRLMFLVWRQALLARSLGQATQARDDLRGIITDFRNRQREADAAGRRDEGPPSWPFEVSPEDQARLPLELARAAEASGDDATARQEYRTWLDAAPPGPERFRVRTSLADMALRRAASYAGRRTLPGDETVTPAEAARRQREEALLNLDAAAPDAPDADALRQNRFTAAAVALDLALGPAAPQALTWDVLASAARDVAGGLAGVFERQPDARLLRLPAALGRLAADAGALRPDPLATPLGWAAEALGEGIGKGYGTPAARRRAELDAILARFGAVAAGRSDNTALDARYHMARILDALGDAPAARDAYGQLLGLLGRARPELALACRLALAKLDLAENRLEAAQRRLLGGYERVGGIRVVPADVPDWNRFARRLVFVQTEGPGPEKRLRRMISPEADALLRSAAAGRRLAPDQIGYLADAINAALRRRDFYDPASFPALPEDPHARDLLAANPFLLSDYDVLWRHRFLLEAAWPLDLMGYAAEGIIETPPFPPVDQLPPGGVPSPDDIRRTLLALARAWLERGGDAGLPTLTRLSDYANTRAAAEFARSVYRADAFDSNYLAANAWEQTAMLLERVVERIDTATAGAQAIREDGRTAAELAELRARQAATAREQAARAYLAASRYRPDAERAGEAAWKAAQSYFAVGLYLRAAEACSHYLTHWGSTREDNLEISPGLVRNLLGRCYWRLGRYEPAIAAYRLNALTRNTPEGKEALYYWGRMLYESSRERPERLGDPAYAAVSPDPDGQYLPETALQAFTRMRRLPDLDPDDTRPWRWSTFDLAKVWYALAEREHAKANPLAAALAAPPRPLPDPDAPPAPAGAAPATPAAPATTPHDPARELWLYERARDHYLEALSRYPLRDRDPGGLGVDAEKSPEDYVDTLCARFSAEYDLARVRESLASLRRGPDGTVTPAAEAEAARARRLWERLSDPAEYPSELFDSRLDDATLYSALLARYSPSFVERPQLGRWKGPWHSPARMARQMRNACQFLANSRRDEGDRARLEGRPADARAFWGEMLRICRRGYERLPMAEASQLLYTMADAERKLGNDAEADNLYRQAVNAARLHPSPTPDGVLPLENAFWGDAAAARLRDLQEGYKP